MFLNPVYDSVITSSSILLQVSATDTESDIARVDLYYSLQNPAVSLQPIATITAAPFEYTWDASSLENGMIYLTATVIDTAGNSYSIPAIVVDLQISTPSTNEINIQSVAPGVPVAFYPTRNALMDPALTVVWTEPAPAADHFEIDLATDAAFANIVESNSSVTVKLYKPTLLKSNTTYYWRVRGVSTDATTSAWSTYSYFRTKLSAPTGLTAVVDSTRPTLSWDNVSTATGYMVTIDTSSAFTSSPLTYTITTNSQKIPVDLKLNKTYYWHVKALGTNSSNWSATTSFTSANPPTIPVLLSPVTNTLLSGDYLTVAWKASGNFPVSYSAQYATDAAFTDIVVSRDGIATTSFTFSDKTLDRNKKYYWRVRSVNAAGQYSQWSSIWIVRTTMTAPVLTSPTDVSHELSLRPTFIWEAVTGATNYTLQVALNNTFSSGLSSTTTSSTSFTLTADQKINKTYYWRVRANGLNPSGWSLVYSYTSANPPSVPVLTTPSDKLLLDGYTVTLLWKESTNNPNQYVLEYADNSAFTSSTIVDGLSTAYIFPTDLTPNTNYYWRVKSINDIGDTSNWSVVRSFRTRLTTPELLLPAEGANPHSLTPTLSWNAVTGAASYTLQIAGDMNFKTSLKKYTVKGTAIYTIPDKLAVNKTIYWRVMANGSNPSYYSVVASFLTPNPPTVPTLLTPTNKSLVGNLNPVLDWKDSTNSVSNYEIQLSTSATFATTLFTYTSGLSTVNVTDTLPANQSIYWRVRALNADTDASGWSSAFYLRTPMLAPVLSTPAEGTRTHTFRPTFTWETVSGATGFTIQISKDSTFTTGILTADTATLTYTRTSDLLQSSTYYWRVRAKGKNTGMWSPPLSFLTIDPPSKPVLSTPANGAVLTVNSVTLDWADSTNSPTGYVLQYANNSAFTTNKVEVTLIGTSTYAIPTAIINNRIYYWRVRSYKPDSVDGIIEYSNWSTAYSFQGPDAPPVILAPDNGAALKVLQPTFSWEAVPDADDYILQISLSSSFSSVTSFTATSTSYTLTSDLKVNRTYYWRLRAEGSADEGWTTTRSYITPDPPDVPTLKSPATNSLLTDTTPTLKWSDADTTVDTYELQFATNTGFTKNLQIITLDSTEVSYTFLTELNPDFDYYYWRVRALNSDAEASSWTGYRSFTYRLPKPALVAPLNSTKVISTKPKLDWDDVADADYYIVEISKSSGFGTIYDKKMTTSTYYTMTKAIPTGTTMYWRVSAYSADDVRGFYSDVYSFSYGT